MALSGSVLNHLGVFPPEKPHDVLDSFAVLCCLSLKQEEAESRARFLIIIYTNILSEENIQ